MSIAEKLTTVAENVPKVYEAGQEAEYDRFWDSFQANGSRTYCTYMFAGPGWNDEIFKPKYNIKPSGGVAGMFRTSLIANMKKCLEDAGVTVDLSASTSVNTAFAYCSALTTLPKLDFSSATTSTQAFYECAALETIDEIKFGQGTKFSQTFDKCSSLTSMTATGVIAQNGLDLSASPLDKQSLLSILNVLQNKTSGTWTVTLGTDNLAKLTDTEKAIATQKGWTLV